ncbi:hypothetical protein BO99DRAFT_124434 [Aspergillus violaceofuscus CBS 115571]|uniref:Uncharacterized protein n=1 Tax=Aspergillus violaceofuscus (strain CBS 115571) TaxID=1450538 RepID=A0A2V5I6B0_ASPV1|nr:hypothetical protein BO99DRAFT_124434 [Aspergillus violaceofuscus CBS 115571]
MIRLPYVYLIRPPPLPPLPLHFDYCHRKAAAQLLTSQIVKMVWLRGMAGTARAVGQMGQQTRGRIADGRLSWQIRIRRGTGFGWMDPGQIDSWRSEQGCPRQGKRKQGKGTCHRACRRWPSIYPPTQPTPFLLCSPLSCQSAVLFTHPPHRYITVVLSPSLGKLI